MATKRILIVEDEQLTRVSLADYLQEAGYETASAADGQTALQLQREQPFDTCIVDIRMPGQGGVETILGLYAISTKSQFIVYTGSPQFSLPSSLKEIGVADHKVVHKPVLDMSIFLELIQADER